MAFVNAFALGVCTVSVDIQGAPSTPFSQVMGLSSSGSFTFESKNYSVSVDSAGNVNLTLVTAVHNNLVFFVKVTPSYSITTASIRASDFIFDTSFVNATASTTDTDSMDFTSINPNVPDPMTLTGLSPTPLYVGISCGVPF